MPLINALVVDYPAIQLLDDDNTSTFNYVFEKETLSSLIANVLIDKDVSEVRDGFVYLRIGQKPSEFHSIANTILSFLNDNCKNKINPRVYFADTLLDERIRYMIFQQTLGEAQYLFDLARHHYFFENYRFV